MHGSADKRTDPRVNGHERCIMAKRQSVADKLRREINRAARRGLTQYRIAKDAGINKSTLSVFMAEPGRQLRLDVAEAIAEALGMKLDLTRRGR